MLERWPVKSLGELCTVVNGGTPKSKISEYWGGDVNWITPAEMGKMITPYIDDTNRKITELGLQKSSAKLFPPHSVILSTRAPIGHLAINTSPMSTNQGCKTLIPNDELEHKYLYYFLYYNKELLDSLGTGVTFKELSGKNLKSVEIPIPPLEEQQRIVSILDEAFELISISQNNLRNNREETVNLIKSCVDEVFSSTIDSGNGKSPVVKLGELCDVITKGTTPTSVGYQFVESGINFVKIESITSNGEFLEHKIAKITSECNEGLKRSQLRNGDILFSIAGALGRTAYVTGSILPANTNQALAIIRLKKSDSVYPQYILKSLSTGFALDQIEKNRAGAAQQNLSLTQMKAFEIPLPSIEVQEQISSKIDIILNNAKLLQNSIERKATGYIELKQSILQEAFSGGLTGGITA